jgi:hypothetical protein
MKRKIIDYAQVVKSDTPIQPLKKRSAEGQYTELFEALDKAEPYIFDPALFKAIGFSSIEQYEVVLMASNVSLAAMAQSWVPALDMILASAGVKARETGSIKFRFKNVSENAHPQYLLLWHFERTGTLSSEKHELVYLQHLVRWIARGFCGQRKNVAKALAVRAELSRLWWRTLILPELRHWGYRTRQTFVAKSGRSVEAGVIKDPAARKEFVEQLHAQMSEEHRPRAVRICMARFGVAREQASRIMATFGWPGTRGRPRT